MTTTINKVVMNQALIVRKMKEHKSVTFGIYRGSNLIEGGFFSVWSAQSAAKDYTQNGEQVITAH
jgi:hypothetical protein